MAELLERHLLRLKARLDSLKRSFNGEERPIDVDLEIELIEEQIRSLSGFADKRQGLN